MDGKSYRRYFEMRPMFLLVLCILPVYAHGLELAVGTSRGPAILKQNGQNYTAEMIGGYGMPNVAMRTLAVDVIKKRVFFAYSRPQDGVLVQSMSLHPDQEDDPILEPIIDEGQGPLSVRSLVYNELNDALYWTDSKKHEISMIKVSDKGKNATVLHRLEDEKHLAGIAIDVCHGLLFWVNNNHESPSLERSDLNGSNWKVIVSSNLFLPIAVAVDSSGNGRLFWADQMEGIKYKIEMSQLDGSGRVVLWEDFYQRPHSLSYVPSGGHNTQAGFIFWLDSNHYRIWELEITDGGKAPNKSPRLIYEFSGYYSAMGLVAMPSFDARNPITCMNTNAWAVKNSTTLGEEGDHSTKMIMSDKPSKEDLPRSALQEALTHMESPGTTSTKVDSFEQTTVSLQELTPATGSPRNDSVNANLLTKMIMSDKPSKEGLPRSALQETTTHMENPGATSTEVDRMEPTIVSLHELIPTTGSPRNDSVNANLLRFRLCDDYCINGEPEEESRNGGPVVCKCHPGYSGLRCEKNLCSNFCLHGSCSLEEVSDGHWQPKCACRVGFTGVRCERDSCMGYCLNNGRCRVGLDGQPKCTCLGNGKLAKGKRCELCPNLLEDVCRILCSQDSSKTSVSIVHLEGKDSEVADAEGPLCVCSPGSNNYVYSVTKGGLNATAGGEWVPSSETSSAIIISPIFLIPVGMCIVLLVIAIFLAFKVMKLRRLPRIKKRIIVSKGSVPLAAGCGATVRGRGSPSGGGRGSPLVEEQQQCEITIENCCNMNVCETPCFEPQLRSPGKSSSSKKTTTHEEKKGLLGSMEGPKTSCGPCPGVEELY